MYRNWIHLLQPKNAVDPSLTSELLLRDIRIIQLNNDYEAIPINILDYVAFDFNLGQHT